MSATDIKHSAKVTDLFGYWPTFHDSEVLEILLSRQSSPRAMLRIMAFETTREVDEQGFFKRIHECIITLEFEDIHEVMIEGFNEQNVLSSVTIQKEGDDHCVVISGLYGVHASLKCAGITVSDVLLLQDNVGFAKRW
jgi:hypothetical protein